MPHFLYGAGEEALKLTQQYVDSTKDTSILLVKILFPDKFPLLFNFLKIFSERNSS